MTWPPTNGQAQKEAESHWDIRRGSYQRSNSLLIRDRWRIFKLTKIFSKRSLSSPHLKIGYGEGGGGCITVMVRDMVKLTADGVIRSRIVAADANTLAASGACGTKTDIKAQALRHSQAASSTTTSGDGLFYGSPRVQPGIPSREEADGTALDLTSLGRRIRQVVNRVKFTP
ncbi:hypothetical protein B0H13DRAFT_1910054 [Mycena leptocephala]|nr:hypothetical protein B0H13DRAFT_1910054 [Mycena leptocephala]